MDSSHCTQRDGYCSQLVSWDTSGCCRKGSPSLGSRGFTFGIGNVSIASCLGQLVTPTHDLSHWQGATTVSPGSASTSLCGGMSELPEDVEHWGNCKTPCLLKAELLSSRNMKKGEALPIPSWQCHSLIAPSLLAVPDPVSL